MEVEEQGETTGVKAPSVAAGAEGNDNRRDAGSGGGVVGEGSGESQTVFRETAQVSDAVTGTPGAESVRGGSGDREEGGQSGRSEEEKKLWATVSSNPSDFKSWTTLLQLAEQNVSVRSKKIYKTRATSLVCVCAHASRNGTMHRVKILQEMWVFQTVRKVLCDG